MNEKENITPGPRALNSLWEKMVADCRQCTLKAMKSCFRERRWISPKPPWERKTDTFQIFTESQEETFETMINICATLLPAVRTSLGSLSVPVLAKHESA